MSLWNQKKKKNSLCFYDKMFNLNNVHDGLGLHIAVSYKKDYLKNYSKQLLHQAIKVLF